MRRASFLNDGDFLWLGLVLLFALGIAFLLPLTPQDYWWYLRVGGDTLSAGAVPGVDALSFSQAGAPVVYHSWLAAVLFYLTYRAGGLPLTFLLRGMLIAAAYSTLWVTARREGAGRIGTALVLLAAVLTGSSNWSLRPQLFAYPLFAFSLWVLYRWNGGENKKLWLLSLFSLLWVNLHGSFVILFLLAGAALVFGKGDRKRLALALAGAFLATFINPRGLGSWGYVLSSVTAASSQQFSSEWLPPINNGWQMNIFFLWLLAFPFLAAFSPRRLSLLEWVWFLGFGILALWGLRYVIWFVFLLVVQTAWMLADWEKQRIGDAAPGNPALNLVLGAFFVLLPLAFLPGLRDAWWKAAPPATENTPLEAVRWLADRPDLPGPLWSEIGFSSYLEFALPSRPVWIDTRFEVFPVTQWEAYRDITNAEWNWQALLDGSGARLLMVSVQNQPRLILALSASGTWCELYRDQVAVIYMKGACGGK